MKNILDEIVAHKREEVEALKRKQDVSVHSIQKVQSTFLYSITQPKIGDIGLIAEIKLQSPSEGSLGELSDVISKVKEYEVAGADAISVVTDSKYFGGSMELFDSIKNVVSIPVFRKEFIIDESQIIESAQHNADALLLIARILDSKTLGHFVRQSFLLGVEPVIEIYDEQDLQKALLTEANIIAVNARDLQSFAINIGQACELGKQIPNKKVFVGFSGVTTRQELEQYKSAGAQAVLVGTHLMKSQDVKQEIRTLKQI